MNSSEAVPTFLQRARARDLDEPIASPDYSGQSRDRIDPGEAGLKAVTRAVEAISEKFIVEYDGQTLYLRGTFADQDTAQRALEACAALLKFLPHKEGGDPNARGGDFAPR